MFSFLRKFLDPILGPTSPAPSFTAPSGPRDASGSYQPDVADVLLAKRLLILASDRRLPIELVDVIVDAACYWPRVSARLPRRVVARGSTRNQNLLLFRTPPICAAAAAHAGRSLRALPEPTTTHPVRRIAWSLKSHDQGWSGEPPATHGTYNASHTWFDAGIERLQLDTSGATKDDAKLSEAFMRAWPDQEPLNPDADDPEHPSDGDTQPRYAPVRPPTFPPEEGADDAYRLQTNVQSKGDSTEHTIAWSHLDDAARDSAEAEDLRQHGRGAATGDGRFVRTLQLGDCVTLWARARYPAWANHVEEAAVEVYFAI